VATSQAILRLGADGHLSTLAGTYPGNGREPPGPVDGIGTKARFDGIGAMAISPTGDLYVTDGGVLRKATPEGKVDTLNPCGIEPLSGCVISYVGGIAVDPAGTVYFTTDEYQIYRLTPDGKVALLAAGRPTCSSVACPASASTRRTRIS